MKKKKQTIMVHKVENGYLIGVANKSDTRKVFGTSITVKEIYACTNKEDVLKQIEILLPELVKVNDMEVEDEEDD